MLHLLRRGFRKSWASNRAHTVPFSALKSSTRPKAMAEVDFDDVLENIDAGKVTAQEFGLILDKISKACQYQSAVDLYEKLPAEERYGGASPSRGVGLLNDHGIVTLIHCYSRLGKPAGFLPLCSAVADKRKYTPFVAEQMLECFADLDRLDMLEALLIGWLSSPSSLFHNLKGEKGRKDVEALDWSHALARTLNEVDDAVKASDDIDAFVESLVVRRADRTSEKESKKSSLTGTGSFRASKIAGELLAQLDTGTLRSSFPRVPVWKRIVAMYANRGAWQQCIYIANFCLSNTSTELLEKNPPDDVAFALRGIAHHTARALCKSERYAQALDFLDSTEDKLGTKLNRPATLALFFSLFSSKWFARGNAGHGGRGSHGGLCIP